MDGLLKHSFPLSSSYESTMERVTQVRQTAICCPHPHSPVYGLERLVHSIKLSIGLLRSANRGMLYFRPPPVWTISDSTHPRQFLW